MTDAGLFSLEYYNINIFNLHCYDRVVGLGVGETLLIMLTFNKTFINTVALTFGQKMYVDARLN